MNFMDIINCIFENKEKYSEITDKDKVDSFYMINKKFSLGYPKIAKFFNDKNIDRASAIDMWFVFFTNTHKKPGWYWNKSPFKKQKGKSLSGPDKTKVLIEFDLDDMEFDFLYKHFKDDIDYELKMIKRWEKNKKK